MRVRPSCAVIASWRALNRAPTSALGFTGLLCVAHSDKLQSRRPDQEGPALEDSDGESEFIQVVDHAPGPEQLVLSDEIAAYREAAMASLTPLERAAFILRHVEDCSTEEIATALEIAPEAAKQAIYRAVRKR